jgi:hypothetical protein
MRTIGTAVGGRHALSVSTRMADRSCAAFSIDRKRGGQMLCSSNVIGPRPEQSAHSRLCGSTAGLNRVTARADEMIGALPGSR